MFELKYRPGTLLGTAYPHWVIATFATREAAETVVPMCANAASIEVVERLNTPVEQGETARIGAQVKTAPNAEFAPLVGACDQHPYARGSASRG